MKNYDYENCPQGLSLKGDRLNFNYFFLNKIVRKQIAKKKKIKILEIGAGGGRNLQFLKFKYGSRVGLFGSDISKTAIDYALSLKIGRFKVADSGQNPFKQKFDLILIIDLLEHLESKKAVRETINNALNCLNKNGQIYISVPIELNRFCLTWHFSKLYYFKTLTKQFYGHNLQFKIFDLKKLVADKNSKIEDIFYSVHFLSQIHIFLFFYIPKILAKTIFGNNIANDLRDSNEVITGKNKNFLSLIKKTVIGLGYPLTYIGVRESKFRKRSPFAAGNLHLLIGKKN